jgi:hypothetical protein
MTLMTSSIEKQNLYDSTFNQLVEIKRRQCLYKLHLKENKLFVLHTNGESTKRIKIYFILFSKINLIQKNMYDNIRHFLRDCSIYS